MSHHILTSHDGQYRVRIGWDRFYQTFFLQVASLSRSESEETPEESEPFLWLGNVMQPSITSLAPILKAAEPYAVISPELQDQLRHEQAEEQTQDHLNEENPQLGLFYEYQLVTGAQELYIARHYDEALAVLEHVLAKNPRAIVAIATKAAIEAELGQQRGEQREEHTQRAILLYRHALEVAQEQGPVETIPFLRVGLGRACADGQQLQEAIEQYDQAILTDKDIAIAWEAKADLFFFHLHDSHQALPYYERAAQLNPGNEIVQYNLRVVRQILASMG